MAEQIQIVIDAVDKATAEIKGISKSISGLGSETKGTGLKFTELSSMINVATMALRTVGDAFSRAYALAKEGAALEYAASKFDRLAESAGTTSEILLKDLREAVRGTRSDMDLMGSAGDFMALGLAKSHDEVVRLTRVAGALGMDMNQLVLTLTNQTTMRFDALGVSVDGFDEKVEALKKTGMDANAAFNEAFLQQAEAQIGKVGDIADTSAGELMKFEANWKNVGDQMKRNFLPTAASVVGALNDLFFGYLEVNQAIEDHEEKMAGSATTYDQYIESMLAEADTLGLLGQFHIKNYEDLLNNEEALKKVSIALGFMTEDEWNAIASIDGMTLSSKDMAEQLRDSKDAADGLAASIKDVDIKTFNATDAMKAYTVELLFNKAAANLDEDAALRLADSMGLLDDETYAILTVLDQLRDKYDINKDGAISAGEAAAGYSAEVANLSTKINQLKDKKVTITVDNVTTYQNVYYEDDYRGDDKWGGWQEHNGANFTVPPGYPNDSFGPIWVESGERVIVIPKDQMQRNNTYNFNYSGNASAQQVQQAYQMARLLE